MTNACLPLSRKYSPMAAPANGARYCMAPESVTEAATIVVYSSTELGEGLRHTSHVRHLLAASDIDAVDWTSAARLVGRLLVRTVSTQIEVLLRLSVSDDQLALAAADRDHSVDCFNARLQRLRNRLSVDDARRQDFDAAERLSGDRPAVIQRLAKRVHDSTQQRHADRDFDNSSGLLDRVSFEIFVSSPIRTTPTESSSRFNARPMTFPGELEQLTHLAIGPSRKRGRCRLQLGERCRRVRCRLSSLNRSSSWRRMSVISFWSNAGHVGLWGCPLSYCCLSKSCLEFVAQAVKCPANAAVKHVSCRTPLESSPMRCRSIFEFGFNLAAKFLFKFHDKRLFLCRF